MPTGIWMQFPDGPASFGRSSRVVAVVEGAGRTESGGRISFLSWMCAGCWEADNFFNLAFGSCRYANDFLGLHDLMLDSLGMPASFSKFLGFELT
jgi:hypothetical protein